MKQFRIGDKVITNNQIVYHINGGEYVICAGEEGKITDIDYDRNEAKVTFTGIINIWLQFYHIDFPNNATPEKYVLITDIVNILDNIKTRAWDYQYLDDNLIEEIINKCKEKSVYFTQY